MIYEPENLKNKRTMYEKKAKMLVTIEFFLWAVILFVYVNIVILILSILVDTFISKISFPMQPGPEIGSISDA